MLKGLEWDPLQQRRKEARLGMLYRIHRGLVDVNQELHLRPSDSRTRGAFYRDRVSSPMYAATFFPRTIVDWNQLPSSVTAVDNLDGFRSSLRAVAR